MLFLMILTKIVAWNKRSASRPLSIKVSAYFFNLFLLGAGGGGSLLRRHSFDLSRNLSFLTLERRDCVMSQKNVCIGGWGGGVGWGAIYVLAFQV